MSAVTTRCALAACWLVVATGALSGSAMAAEPSSDASPERDEGPAPETRGEHALQVSLVAGLRPALGDAKRDGLDVGGPELGSAYGVRVELSVHEWWYLGVSLSRTSWSISGAPEGALGPLSGDIDGASATVRFQPLKLDTDAGSWALYALGHLGAALPRDARRIGFTSEGVEPGARPLLTDGGGESLEAGNAAGGGVGLSYHPTRRLGFFVDGGIDWHHAIFVRGLPPGPNRVGPEQSVARLWLGQAIVNAGVSVRF